MPRSLLLVFFALAAFAGFVRFPPLVRAPALLAAATDPYNENRVRFAFRLYRLDLVNAALERALPTEQAVALGPELVANEFLRQRFAEALYPRAIDQAAPFSLNFHGTLLLANLLGANQPLYLSPAPPEFGTAHPAAASFWFPCALAALALSLLVLGLGALVLVPFGGAAAGEMAIAGLFVIGVAYTGSTLAQLPLPHVALPALGALGVALAIRRLRRPRSFNFSILAPFLLVLLLGAYVTIFPIFDWDARSIWFFRAHELFQHGYFTLGDAMRSEYAWAHSDYPLALPGWLAFFSSFSGEAFSERAASFGVWAMYAALAAPLWQRAREELGRTFGTGAALCLLLGAGTLAARGAADGPLVLLLSLAYLSLGRGSAGRLGWLCVWAASLLKWEGLLFALLLAVWRGRVRKGFIGFVPAFFFLLWSRFEKLPSDYGSASLGVIKDGLSRAGTILSAVPGVVMESPFLVAGAVALVLTLIARIRGGRWSPALWPALFTLAFAFVAFLLTPRDLQWHIETAMGRVLMHAAAFSLLALAETAAREERGG